MIAQSLWIGDTLSTMETLCIRSFLKQGVPFHLYAYDRITNLPKGAEVKDGSRIIPRDKIFRYGPAAGRGEGSYSGFSNYFRYALLEQVGNFWVDLDVICLKPFPEGDYLFVSEIGPHQQPQAASCVIKTPAGSEIAAFWRQTCEEKEFDKLKWGEIGPHLVAEGVKKYMLGNYMQPVVFCCPINFFEVETLVRPQTVELINQEPVYAVHLWNEMWRRRGLDKNATYPIDSIYEHLKVKYGRHKNPILI